MRKSHASTCVTRRATLSLLLCAGALATAPPMARAQSVGGALGFGSDNLYRGRSLTVDRPAWLADLHYAFADNWLIGAGASAQRPPHETAAAQVTLYLDRHWQLDEAWGSSVGVVHYDSPWSRYSGELRYDELNAAVDYRGEWRVTLAYSPNSPGPLYGRQAHTARTLWSALTWRHALYDRLGMDAGVGRAQISHSVLRSYDYANIGLNYGIGDVTLFLERVWAQMPAALYAQSPYPAAGLEPARWTVSAVWTF